MPLTEFNAPSRRPDQIPIPDRVQAGVELLDREMPDWWQRIDLDQLDIGSGCNCVLGQLHPIEDLDTAAFPDDAFLNAMSSMDLWSGAAVVALGFVSTGADLAQLDYLADRLTAAWRNRIEARRVAAGSAA